MEYLEIVAKNMTPIWDSEQSKYVAEEEKEENETASLSEEISFLRNTNTNQNNDDSGDVQSDNDSNTVESTSLDSEGDDDLPF